jgi:hypothetical protein
MCSCSITIYTGSVARPPRDMTRRSTHESSTSPSTPSGLASPRLDQVRYMFVTARCLDEITFSNVPYSQDIVERSTKERLADPRASSDPRNSCSLTSGGELVARHAWQICPGTWRLNIGNGAVLWPRPGCPVEGIMTEHIFAPGHRSTCEWVLVFQGFSAHTGNHVVLLQTPAAAGTADTGVKLSAEASRVVTGLRSASHSHGVRIRCRRSAPGPTASMADQPHPGVNTSGHRP